VHARHDDCDVYDVPPTEYVPAAHGFAVADPVPAGQKDPAPHATWFTLDEKAGHA